MNFEVDPVIVQRIKRIKGWEEILDLTPWAIKELTHDFEDYYVRLLIREHCSLLAYQGAALNHIMEAYQKCHENEETGIVGDYPPYLIDMEVQLFELHQQIDAESPQHISGKQDSEIKKEEAESKPNITINNINYNAPVINHGTMNGDVNNNKSQL